MKVAATHLLLFCYLFRINLSLQFGLDNKVSRSVGYGICFIYGYLDGAILNARLAKCLSISSLMVISLSLEGCNLGWEKPDLSIPLPSKFRESPGVSSRPISSAKEFAVLFGSKELSKLVELSLENNLDIAAAAARIREADAQARMASAPLWPNVSLQDIARTNRTSGTTLNLGSAASLTTGSYSTSPYTPTTGIGRNYGFFQLGIGAASYTIDFWGVNEDASYASRILANASRYNRDVVEITTVSAVMNAYFQVLTAKDRLRVAQNNVQTAQNVYNVVMARYEVGAASSFDTAQQETLLERQKSLIPPLEETLRQTSNILSVLIGQTPESLGLNGGSLSRLKFPKISPGLPSEVLLRRPDLAQVEAQLASQEFSVLQARASFFPSITLLGLYGPQSALITNLLSPQAIAWQAASQLAQPIFDGYYLQGMYENQKGRYAELAALYRKQILTALSDTENALIAEKQRAKQLTIQSRVVLAARKALDIAQLRMQGGTIDIIALAVSQNEYFTALDQECVMRLNYFQAASSLYQALGGGWSPTTRNAEIARANIAYEENKGPWP
jgi:outer membrane protein, multidrug efflux system